MAVVCRNQRNPELFFESQQIRPNLLFERESLILDFEKEVSFAKDVAIRSRGIPRSVVLAGHQVLAQLARKAAGKPDQSLRVLREELLAHPRLVVHAVERSFRRDLYQVAIAFVVLRQHQQMVVFIAFGRSAMVVLLADVEFAADDRLDSGVLGRVVEGNCTKNVAMVGHRDRGLTQLGHAFDQPIYVAGAVQKRVIGVEMEVGKLRHSGGSLLPILIGQGLKSGLRISAVVSGKSGGIRNIDADYSQFDSLITRRHNLGSPQNSSPKSTRGALVWACCFGSRSFGVLRCSSRSRSVAPPVRRTFASRSETNVADLGLRLTPERHQSKDACL